VSKIGGWVLENVEFSEDQQNEENEKGEENENIE